eukprot:UN25015
MLSCTSRNNELSSANESIFPAFFKVGILFAISVINSSGTSVCSTFFFFNSVICSFKSLIKSTIGFLFSFFIAACTSLESPSSDAESFESVRSVCSSPRISNPEYFFSRNNHLIVSSEPNST